MDCGLKIFSDRSRRNREFRERKRAKGEELISMLRRDDVDSGFGLGLGWQLPMQKVVKFRER